LNKIPIIYIIGAGRSGSTLLDLIMGSHSQITGVGELSNWFFRKKEQSRMTCTCGKNILNCDFWQKVFKNIPQDLKILDSKLKINQDKINFLFNRKKYFFAGNREIKFDLKKYLELNYQIYRNILDFSGKKFVLDSSKEMDRAEVLVLDNRFEMVFVHLVRDGRGTTYSYKRKHGGIISPMMLWVQNNLKAEIFKRRYPGKTIFLSYEDFCKNPREAIEKILKKVNLSFEPQMMNYRSEVHHQVDGNPLRIRDDHQEIREDLAWKKELPLLDKIIFNILFGWLNLYYHFK